MKVTVLGSCVSRVSLLRGNTSAHGIIDGEQHGTDGLKLEYFLDKHNIALAMCPPPFSKSEVNTITSQELWDNGMLMFYCEKSDEMYLIQEKGFFRKRSLFPYENSFNY